MNPHEGDEPERDAWLREALRHAPDADAAPPPGLRESILRQARAASGAPPPARAAHKLLAAWSWLARPPVAAGFASVMVATLLGLMWWDRPMDETLPHPSAPTLQRGADTAPPRAEPASGNVSAAAPPVSIEPTAPAPFSDERKATAAEPTLPAPTIAASPQPAAAEATRMREAPPPAANDPAALRRDESSAATGALSARAVAKAAAPGSPAAPLAELLASIAEQPQRWTWRRAGATQAMSPNLQRWLLRLDGATTQRWGSVAARAPPAEGDVLRLYRDGALHTTLRLDDAGGWIARASAPQRAWLAALAPGALADLKRALDEAAP